MKKEDVLVCEGISEHCFLNNDGKIISLKKEYPEVYQALTNCMRDFTEGKYDRP